MTGKHNWLVVFMKWISGDYFLSFLAAQGFAAMMGKQETGSQNGAATAL